MGIVLKVIFNPCKESTDNFIAVVRGWVVPCAVPVHAKAAGLHQSMAEIKASVIISNAATAFPSARNAADPCVNVKVNTESFGHAQATASKKTGVYIK